MSNRTSKPKLVKKLNEMWKSTYTKSKFLKEVSIEKYKPLRGISSGCLKFEFPVSVITGENGSGKTTFTELSVLAFHASQRPFTPFNNIEYFDFSYFFKSSAKERFDKGIKIRWEYTDNTTDNIEKGLQRWMRYIRNSGEPRRPTRGTEFIGISRILPAFEKKGYHGYFSDKKRYEENKNSDQLNNYMTKIMSKKYTSTSQLTYTNAAGLHKVHSYNETHSSFNAGAGEECLSIILSTMLNCPEGSFVAIEEIEIGLHPRTLPKIADAILEIASNRKLQVIVTSHSPEFLRACPKESIILAERVKDSVEFTNQPNIEYAISRIGGEQRPRAQVICEDEVASHLISSAMPAALRAICPVVAFGGKDQLIEKAKAIHKVNASSKIIIVWDGEVNENKITEAKEKSFFACRLPGNTEPEKYILEKLKTEKGKEFLSTQYKLSSNEIESLISALTSLDDHHDIPYTIGDMLHIQEYNHVMIEMCRFITKEFDDDFSNLIECINSAIENT